MVGCGIGIILFDVNGWSVKFSFVFWLIVFRFDIWKMSDVCMGLSVIGRWNWRTPPLGGVQSFEVSGFVICIILWGINGWGVEVVLVLGLNVFRFSFWRKGLYMELDLGLKVD